MSRVGLGAAAGALALSGVVSSALGAGVTDPKTLVVRLKDFRGNYAVTGSYAKRDQANRLVYRHGMVREYQRFFASKSQNHGILYAGSIAAAFKGVAGAKWTMRYLPKKVAQRAGKAASLRRFHAPHFAQQSLAFRLSGSAQQHRFSGLVIAMRHGRYDGIILTLGTRRHFKAAATYRLARIQAGYLAKAK